MSPLVEIAMARLAEGDTVAAEEAIASMPPGAEQTNLYGRVALRQRDWLKAHDIFQRAVAMDRAPADNWMCLGMAQYELGMFDRAVRSFEATVLRSREWSKAWQKLGACLGMMQRHAEALAVLERALSYAPDDPECHHAMGIMCSVLGVDDGAAHHFAEALRLGPGNALARTALGVTQLRQGLWKEGWEAFEARWSLPVVLAPTTYRQKPLYEGTLEEMRGKRVLLRCEQGFGDALHFARYVRPLSAIARHVILETQSELVRLLQFALPHIEVVEAPRMEMQVLPVPDDRLPLFDLQTSLMSLPLLFGTTPEDVPPPLVIPTAAQHFGKSIGLCFEGGPRRDDPQANAVDQRRSIQDKGLCAPIFRAAGNQGLLLHYDVLHDTYGTKDWWDTAAIVAGLDLVVTVDTAIAHLAGSLGVETWLLNRFDSCWRWGLTGETTPWYPSMRLFRQDVLGEWEAPIQRVAEELNARAS
jgi:Tfp pilus assembly protein PilF